MTFPRLEGQVGDSEFEEAYQDQHEIRGIIFSEMLGTVPRRPTLTIAATASVAETIRAMNDNHIGCALVVRDGRLVGIFTERDVLTKVAAAGLDIARTPVETVMTPDPDTLPASASIAVALRKMSVEGYRHIPLINPDGSPVGVVGVRDIVSWLIEILPDSVLNLPPDDAPSFPKTMDGG